MSVENIIFLVVVLAAIALFTFQVRKISASIKLGLPLKRTDRRKDRLNTMLLVAFGQQKMFKRPFAATLHALIYVGFIIINIEVLEILIDGITGSHRALGFLGPVYDGLMASNEILGFLVIIACVILLYRRNVMKVSRYHGTEMSRWPKMDANIILVTEIVLMIALFMFNGAEAKAIELAGGRERLIAAGFPIHGIFPISGMLTGIFPSNPETLQVIAKIGWWVHIVGILAFLNYLPRSKHFHIIMAFPNTYHSNLEPKGKFTNNEFITHEIKSMLDDSYQSPNQEDEVPRFGAKDVVDLPWKNLMDAYTCTECGRCTDNCPANITGKKLSPRKVIMDTRDRLEELSRAGITTVEGAKKHAEEHNNTLLGENYLSPEELWACTTCNACTEACPVNIDHVSSIMDLRRYLVLEESSAPQELNIMFNNIENNGAPWAMPATTRFDWAQDIEMPADKMAPKAAEA